MTINAAALPQALQPSGGALSIAEQVGSRIYAFRVISGLSQADLARKAGLDSKQTICRLERGATDSPALFSVALCASALGVDLSDLLATAKGEPTPEACYKAAKRRAKARAPVHMAGYSAVRFGEAVHALRKASGETAKQCAARLKIQGLDSSELSRLETATRAPSLLRVYQLAHAFGTTPYRLFLPSLLDDSYKEGNAAKFRA